jgi:hypothetical protein
MRPYLGVLPRVLSARNSAFSAPRICTVDDCGAGGGRTLASGHERECRLSTRSYPSTNIHPDCTTLMSAVRRGPAFTALQFQQPEAEKGRLTAP